MNRLIYTDRWTVTLYKHWRWDSAFSRKGMSLELGLLQVTFYRITKDAE